MKKYRKTIFTILFLIYVAIVLRITVFRSTFTLQHLCQDGRIILTIFAGYIDLIRQKNWFAFIYLFVGNIIWFVPFGMYVQYIKKPKKLLYIAFCGFLFSLIIETLQYVFGTGFSELDDLILNTLGAWIGAVLVRMGMTG